MCWGEHLLEWETPYKLELSHSVHQHMLALERPSSTHPYPPLPFSTHQEIQQMQQGSSVYPISLALPAGKLVGEDVCPPGNVGNIVQPQCSVWILLLFVCDVMCVVSQCSQQGERNSC